MGEKSMSDYVAQGMEKSEAVEKAESVFSDLNERSQAVKNILKTNQELR